MSYPVIKGAAYSLIHGPSLLTDYGTTQSVERAKNPESEYLKKLPANLRTFEHTVGYAPNQVYIGNITPSSLVNIARPWHEHPVAGASRNGRYGEIMREDEFYGLMKVVDAFDLVMLEEGFVAALLPALSSHPLFGENDLKMIGSGHPQSDIDKLLADEHIALPLKLRDQIVGCIRRAHDVDENLSAHVILENTVTKASATLALRSLIKNAVCEANEVEYVIECSEEACGDMNQRGGGNFAKAIAEMAGCVNATGSDTRGFCAAPAHALIEAAALVQSGVYKNVVVVAGGSIAKLGMNAKDHVNKGLPVLEDMMGTFAVCIAEDDGINPRIRTDLVGRHKVGSGAAPQAVMQAIVTDPLDRAGWKVTDIDKYSPEMQNPDITEPAGAGDVPKSNLKMIAALGVKRGELARDQIDNFTLEHGVPGYAPTQGHIPSGVPFIGSGREMILEGDLSRVMIIGKGSLFLGRMTNLFDGVSFVMDKNPGRSSVVSNMDLTRTRVGITLFDSEHGQAEVIRGAELAQRDRPDLEIVLIGNCENTALSTMSASTASEAHQVMEKALQDGNLAAAVTMHFPFPVGVATIGRVITPGKGREMLIASSTGTSSTAGRVQGMVYNAIYGLAAAKALGMKNPTLGLLNLDNASQAERVLRQMNANGYGISWADSQRADGGALMRGNDLMTGACDVMVTDTLTGNVLMKLFSAFTTGGDYESVGYGYGPSTGQGYRYIINIISRASGAPVIANALKYAGDAAKGGLPDMVAAELAAAKKAGLDELLAALQSGPKGGSNQTTPEDLHIPACPPAKVTDEELHGVDILALEDAVHELWKAGIYASSGMGCTGPVVMISGEDHDQAVQVLKEAKYL